MQDIVLELDQASHRPIFLQLAHAIITAIETGRLKPGQRLPGARTLARTLKLNRNTVDAAYHEAGMQGWLEAETARGTFVARDLPVETGAWRARDPSPAARNGNASPVAAGQEMLRFSDGVPDARLIPVADLSRALRHALRGTEFLDAGGYGDPCGAPVLREALAGHLAGERGMAVSADDLIVTRGSQMALFLAVGVLLSPGEAIAVEEPGYPLAVAAFRAAGARVVPVRVDEEGFSLTCLAAALRQTPGLRAIYVTPHHQYPTTVTMSAARRIGLMDMARRHGLKIIEDDYDHEYRFDGRPVLPLAARAGGEIDLVYVGSLSKVLAPGIRLGYAAASAPIVRRMAERRQAIDRQGDVALECAVGAMLRDGDLGRHVRKTRRIYHARRDLLAALLKERLGDSLSLAVPAGGLALWVRLAADQDAESWSKAAARLGLAVPPGARLCIDDRNAPQAFRLGFASLNEGEIVRGVELLKAARDGATA